LAALLTLGIPIVLVRVLDQSTFGYYKQLFLVAGTMVTLLSLTLPGSLYYLVPRSPRDSQRFHVQAALLLLGLGVVAGVVLVLGREPLSALFDAPLNQYMLWIALYTALSLPASLLVVSPMADRRARLTAILVVGFDLSRGVLLIVVALLTRSLTVVLVATCAHMAAQVTAVAAYLIWRSDGAWTPSLRHLRAQLSYSLPLTGAALIALVQIKLHSFYVAASFSAAEFAIYAVGTLSLPLIGEFSRTVGEVVLIESSEQDSERNVPEMRRVWHHAVHVLGLVLFPIFLISELFAGDVIRFLFGEAYLGATPIFRVFLLLLPFSILLDAQMLQATRDLKVKIGADAASLVTTIAVLMALASVIGPIGAVVSLLAGRVAFMLVASRRMARRMKLTRRSFLPWKPLVVMLALATAATGVVSLVVNQLGLPLLPRLLVGGSLAVTVYAVPAWRWGLVPDPEKELARRWLSGLLRGTVKTDPTSADHGDG
jgi:O-antigen/teichoic acid export membrane protein